MLLLVSISMLFQLMLFLALFTIAKVWKQPKCLLMDEWITKIQYIYAGILISLKTEGNPLVCDNMDEPGGHCAK